MNVLNISEVKGKKQKLQNLIENSVKGWDIFTPLPDLLLMTEDQYNMLKRTKNFGDRGEALMFKAEERIYHTEYNAMEVRIVTPGEKVID